MYRIGTVVEAEKLAGRVPKAVLTEALRIVRVLDMHYGENRDVFNSDGGFVFIAQNRKDLEYFRKHHINPDSGLHEDVGIFQTEKGPYLNVFFLCNNEFSINLLIPASLLPNLSPDAGINRL